MSDELQKWLSSQECLSVLNECAKNAINRAERITLQIDDSYLDRKDYLSAVTGQLWCFVKDRAEEISRKATIPLASGDDDALTVLLTHEFLDFCLEKRRADSPFHSYYRHVRSILSKEDSIRFEPKGRKGSYYAYSDIKTLDFLPEALNEQRYSTWAIPDVAYMDIHNKPAILRLSKCFWDVALKLFLAEYLLPVRELVHYVSSVYPLLISESPESSFDVSEDEDGAPQTVGDQLITSVDSRDDDAWKRQLPIIEMDIIDTQLEVLARDCTKQLSGKQKILLVMKLEDEMTLAEMCTKVGEKNPSTLLYHIKKGLEIIHEKWSLWGPPTRKQFTEVDDEEYLIFNRKVMEFCKNAEPCFGNKEGVYA